MRFIHATYNLLHNCIDVTTFDGYILRIDCGKAEEGLHIFTTSSLNVFKDYLNLESRQT